MPHELFEASRLGVSKSRAGLVLKSALLLPEWSADGATEVLKQTAFWRTKRGEPLAPSTRMLWATALSHAVLVLTGLSPATAAWKGQLRIIKRKMSHHIPRQAVPASKRDLLRAIAREPCHLTRLSLRFAWALGLRLGHVCRFQARDVVNYTTLSEDKIAILRARGLKNSKPGMRGYHKYLPLSGLASPLLQHLQLERRPRERLFDTSRAQMVKALKRANPTLTGHSVRVGAATLLAAKGSSLKQIRDFLGHESVQSTRMYVRPMAGQRHVRRQLSVTTSIL